MKTVMVLLSTYNGEKYLKEQIDSVLSQKNVNVNILVRDDGSYDETKTILQKYQDEGKLKWYTGNNLKATYSFLDLLHNTPKADYYAFCDQDDVWNENKLIMAINKLENLPKYKPALYTGRLNITDSELNIKKVVIFLN